MKLIFYHVTAEKEDQVGDDGTDTLTVSSHATFLEAPETLRC